MKGITVMKIDRNKLEIAKARACMSTSDMLKTANVPQGTYSRILTHNTTAKTAGKIAKALGVDVLDIIADEQTQSDTTNHTGKAGRTA